MIRSQIATLACLSSGYVFTGVSSCLFLPSPLRQSVHHRCLQNIFGPACFCVCAVFWYQSHLVVTLVVLERTESCFEVWRQTDLIHMAKTKVSRGVFEWGLGSALCREPAAPRAGTPVLLPLNTGSLQHQMWGGLESPRSSGKQQPHGRLAFPHLCMHVALALGYPCSMPSAAYRSILGRMRAVLGITRLLKVSASLLLPPRVSPHLRKLSVRVSREKSHFLTNPDSNKRCCG